LVNNIQNTRREYNRLVANETLEDYLRKFSKKELSKKAL
jgi:hypothetical protein